MRKGAILLAGLALAGTAALSSRGVEASTGTASVTATAFTISPSPTIAAEGSLAPGQQVTLTLTAWNGSAVDPHAKVWIAFTSFFPNGHLAYGGHGAYGTLAVNSTSLKFNGNDNENQYKTNAAGTLTLTFTADTTAPPKAGFWTGIFARLTSGGHASTSNSMAYSEYTYSS
jgi:hypothetical protein